MLKSVDFEDFWLRRPFDALSHFFLDHDGDNFYDLGVTFKVSVVLLMIKSTFEAKVTLF